MVHEGYIDSSPELLTLVPCKIVCYQQSRWSAQKLGLNARHCSLLAECGIFPSEPQHELSSTEAGLQGQKCA